MYPKPFEKFDTLGEHLHLSLSKAELGSSFLAGLLGATPALAALTMPSYDSHTRMLHCGTGWVCWGTHNRSATYRQIREGYWELRQFDGCANKDLALAAVLFVGLAAVKKKSPLTIKGQPTFLASPGWDPATGLGTPDFGASARVTVCAL
jgi:glutamine synthetase